MILFWLCLVCLDTGQPITPLATATEPASTLAMAPAKRPAERAANGLAMCTMKPRAAQSPKTRRLGAAMRAISAVKSMVGAAKVTAAPSKRPSKASMKSVPSASAKRRRKAPKVVKPPPEETQQEEGSEVEERASRMMKWWTPMMLFSP